MNKKGRWAAIVGVICGAELVAVAVIGGAGIAAFVSLEGAIVVTLLGAAGISIVVDRRRRNTTPSKVAAERPLTPAARSTRRASYSGGPHGGEERAE